MPLSIKGQKAFTSRLETIGDAMLKRIPEVMLFEAEGILEDSKENYVPVDKGVLIEDNAVIGPVVENNVTTVDIAFGLDEAADYAAFVHEHPTHSKQNKYLEKPMRAAAPGMAVRISKRLNVDTL